MSNTGTIVGVNGNMITVEFGGDVQQNEVGYAKTDSLELKAEIIRIRGRRADMQVFEDTTGLTVGNPVEFSGELLTVELGPGLLTQIFDGLQNPLPQLAEKCGFFLQRGMYLPALPRAKSWDFTPAAKPGDTVTGGDTLGTVPEGIFQHHIMVPFSVRSECRVEEVAPAGAYKVEQVIARLKDDRGQALEVTLMQRWPVKIPIKNYVERIKPVDPLVTKIRIIDTFFPVARGGTFCVPGPFGAGKTVLQQMTSRQAEVDVVIIAACGERAGEVVETLREFPEVMDPRTGRSLMERTIIICNTSSMPVAAREASVYTGVTLAEYYRQMGLHALLLADSTSRWAQALREMSGRLEEIPGEEAFPAYLESVIAAFYERAGLVRLKDGRTGSITVGGTVSPAGGNFEEPVTQATLKVVGAFHGLSRERSDARKFPAIHPLDSWTKYTSVVSDKDVAAAKRTLRAGTHVEQMMKVIGEEGTSIDDFVTYLKAKYLDDVYLQQDGFDAVDGATPADRQKYVFGIIVRILETALNFADKDAARKFFNQLTQKTKDWNRAASGTPEFQEIEKQIQAGLAEVTRS
ncbi:MAG: V-type ATP synthase subunit A [Candidatus Lindowbacteria bacterium RIFCSPLOWO2_12_FULL_62_27]|nr:MAG: V-type ATP synthase subunit A [Candidatus Lindowbacteria bacterium RIFCSPLOWO2_12_FULL_62_27]OGH57473.1 MAG: V-type ATP synthase subunit A [Candidatus Lindowbacteria bacterium RIFCSPLOWO2_02_FULL_62_12]